MSGEAESGEKKALYQIVLDGLLKRIKDNGFSFDRPLCTEKSLMEEYGVSRITAKRAITELEGRGLLYRKRGVGSFVSRELYSRSSGGANRQFALVIPFSITKGGMGGTFQAANAALNAAGYGMSIYITDDTAVSRGREVLGRLLQSDVAGVVYYPGTNDIHLEILDQFALRGKPVVILDIGTDCPYLHSVSSDNYAGGRLLTEHLLSLGHTRIGYLSGCAPEKRSTVRDRFGGYLSAMRRAGVSVDPRNVITTLDRSYHFPENGGPPPLHGAIRQLVENGVTAVATENDEMAFYTVMACGQLGIDVPGQLSVCGFDDSEFASMVNGGITTVAQDFPQMGRETAALLLETPPSPEGKKIVVPVRLTVRGTTGPVRE